MVVQLQQSKKWIIKDICTTGDKKIMYEYDSNSFWVTMSCITSVFLYFFFVIMGIKMTRRKLL